MPAVMTSSHSSGRCTVRWPPPHLAVPGNQMSYTLMFTFNYLQQVVSAFVSDVGSLTKYMCLHAPSTRCSAINDNQHDSCWSIALCITAAELWTYCQRCVNIMQRYNTITISNFCYHWPWHLTFWSQTYSTSYYYCDYYDYYFFNPRYI